MEVPEASVFRLVGDLCTLLYQEHKENKYLPSKTLAKCKKTSFEILLKTSHQRPTAEEINKQLRFQRFRIHLDKGKLRADQFDSCLDALKVTPSDLVQASLELMLALCETASHTVDEDVKQPFLGCAPTVQTVGTPRPYPIFTGSTFELPTHFQHAFDQKLTRNPYVLHQDGKNEHFFSQTLTGMLADESSVRPATKNPTFFTDSNIVLGIEAGDFFQNRTLLAGQPRQLESHPEKSDEMDIQAEKLMKRVQYGQAWEFLGHQAILTELPFATDSVHDVILHLLAQREAHVLRKFQAKIVPLDLFLEDLRSLVAGIQSESFRCNDLVVFEMLPHLTVPGVAPDTLHVTVQSFLECGTCFKRLKLMIQKNPYSLRLAFDGFVFTALCQCIEKFLSSFRLLVWSFRDESILGLAARIAPVRRQLIALSRIVKIHPDDNNEVHMPIGSEFLGYLHKEIVQVTQRDVSVFLMYILKYCCHIYFSNFQKWIFNGYLQDEHKELFVYFVDHYRTNTKHYFDKAYLIRKQAVPGFLQGYEEEILLCGKYTMLLKAFKPTHPLFTLPTQSLMVCLSYAQISKQRLISATYIANAIELCGPPVTVKQIFQRRQQAKEEFYRCAEASSRTNLAKWRQEQQELAEELARRRAELREQLQQQLKENEAHKLALRKAELELDQVDMRQARDVEDRLLLEENEARQRTIEHYQELERMIDERRVLTDKVIASLQAEIEQNDNALEKRNSVMAMSVGSDYFSVNEEDEEKPATPGDQDPQQYQTTATISGTMMKKSASDTFNANTEVAHAEFLQNKGKILRSTLSELMFRPDDLENCNVSRPTTLTAAVLTDAQRNKLKVLTQEYHQGDTETTDGINNNACQTVGGELTDLQKNRLKVLGHDWNAPQEATRKSSTELTDLQKNRQKVLNQEFGVVVETLKQPTHTQQIEPEETALSRNRRKVLQSEYAIVTGIASGQLPTPTPSEEGDVAMGCEVQSLKLNTDIARGVTNLETSMVVDETPFTALNTAGQLARTAGFEFPVKEASPPRARSSVEVEYRMASIDPASVQLMDVISRRQNDFFGLCRFADELTPALEVCTDNEELQSLDSTTLTRFLQMSVVIPLNAHMEIVNQEIMKMFLVDLQILDHFKSLRNYFFLMDGEFGSHICDRLLRKLEIEASPPDELLKYHTLHSILDAALGSSINTDKNAERLSFIVQQLPERFELKSPDVLGHLALSYNVQWPLNLILNPETVEQYTKIFKYLIKVRRISWIMEQSFQMLKELHKQHGKVILLSPQYRHVQQIRHKLAHFVQALQNHITRTALQGSWKLFKLELESVRSMENLYRKHTNYIKKILFLCMLNRRSVEFHNNVEDIFKVVLKFYRHLKAKTWLKTSTCFVHQNYPKLLQDEKDFEKLIKYTVYLGNKIVLHGYQQEIGEFVNLININGYYDNSQTPASN